LVANVFLDDILSSVFATFAMADIMKCNNNNDSNNSIGLGEGASPCLPLDLPDSYQLGREKKCAYLRNNDVIPVNDLVLGQVVQTKHQGHDWDNTIVYIQARVKVKFML
jgi:hypothetical protein